MHRSVWIGAVALASLVATGTTASEGLPAAAASMRFDDGLRLNDDTVLVSPDGGGSVDGVVYRAQDIVAYDPGGETFSLYFDGSDVGIAAGVDAIELRDDGTILISLNRRERIGELGWVDDSDVIRFIPTSLGTETAGSFEMLFDGSDVGLTTNAEDVDAVAVNNAGDLVLSTLGRVSAQSFRGKGQDLFSVHRLVPGPETAGELSMYLDGSDQSLRAATERINGASIASRSQAIAVTTLGRYDVGLSGTDRDIFICDPTMVNDAVGGCDYSLLLRRPLVRRVDAVHVGPPARLALPCLDCGAAALRLLIDDPAPVDFAQFGSQLAVLGDVSGDGISDVVVTAPDKGRDGDESVGTAFVASGSDGQILYELPHPQPRRLSSYGRAIAVIGHVDGDSIPDVAIGAPGHDRSGVVFVVSGADGSRLFRLESQVVPSTDDRRFGNDVAAIGDIDGDGVSEIAVGADGPGSNQNQPQGRLTVFSGADGVVLYVVENPDPDPDIAQLFGGGLAGLGDVNDDDVPDIAVGAWQQDGEGAVFVLSGVDGTVLDSIEYPGGRHGQDFGRRISAVSDLDGDGVSEVAASADLATVAGLQFAGTVYVFSGADGSLLRRLDDPFPQAGATFGRALVDVGDLTADGLSELAVGAPGVDRVVVFSGANGALVSTITASDEHAGGLFGRALAAESGVAASPPTLVVGAPLSDVDQVRDQGRAFGYSLLDLG